MSHHGRYLRAAVIAAALLGSLTGQAARAQDSSFGLELGLDYSSRYLFRGIDLLDGEPTPVPRIILSSSGFSAYFYGYYGKMGQGGPDFEEHDFGLEYAAEAGPVSLTLGSVAYTYSNPKDWEDEIEVYAIAGLGGVLLEPTLSVYYDAKGFDAGYASLGVSHSFPLAGDRLSLGLSTSLGYDLGYNSQQFDIDQSRGFNDLLLGTDLAWTVYGGLSLHVLVQRSIALDVLDAAGQGDETVVSVGAAFGL